MDNSKASSLNVLVVLGIFAILGFATLMLVPRYNLFSLIGWSGLDEWHLNVGIITYTVIILNTLVLWFAKKLLHFKVSWFLYSLIYSGLIIYVKFIFSAASYKGINSNVLTTGILVGILYLLGVYIIYLFFNKNLNKVFRGLSHKSEELKFIFAAIIFLFINAIRILVFSFSPLSATSTASYLSSVFQGGGLLLSLFLFLITFCAVEAFDRAKNNLKNAFILSFGLILIYHILWIVFVNTVVTTGGLLK